MKNIIIIIFSLCIVHGAFAQVPEPAKPQSKPVLLLNGTAHLGTGEVIENSAVAFENGKITLVADARTIRIDMTKYEVINIEGQHVYPGLILPNTTLGLEETASVRATLDHTEIGEINAHIRSVVAYSTDSEIIATLRYNGILLAQSTPNGGLISGSSSIMKLDGWNWEDAAYVMDDGLHVRWPAKSFNPRWWMGETQSRPNPRYKDQIATIEKYLEDATVYAKAPTGAVPNLVLAAAKPLLEGKQRVFLHVDTRPEIMESVQLFKKHKVENIVLVGARDAYYAMDFIKEHNVPVLIDQVHRLPAKEDEDVDLPYKLPALLHQQGILVGLTYPRLQNSRNLPFFAGTLVAHGLDKEEALKLVTSNTAKILGIDKMAGTIEQGKDANLVVSAGDVLDMRTNKVTYAFITGMQINLDGKQQALYERFKNKYSEDK